MSEGISFLNYKKQKNYSTIKPYNVSETGLYCFAGFGCYIWINKYFTSLINIGFEGFHMAPDNLIVNPHGLTLRIACVLE